MGSTCRVYHRTTYNTISDLGAARQARTYTRLMHCNNIGGFCQSAFYNSEASFHFDREVLAVCWFMCFVPYSLTRVQGFITWNTLNMCTFYHLLHSECVCSVRNLSTSATCWQSVWRRQTWGLKCLEIWWASLVQQHNEIHGFVVRYCIEQCWTEMLPICLIRSYTASLTHRLKPARFYNGFRFGKKLWLFQSRARRLRRAATSDEWQVT